MDLPIVRLLVQNFHQAPRHPLDDEIEAAMHLCCRTDELFYLLLPPLIEANQEGLPVLDDVRVGRRVEEYLAITHFFASMIHDPNQVTQVPHGLTIRPFVLAHEIQDKSVEGIVQLVFPRNLQRWVDVDAALSWE
jgi:hypothetical protein